MALTRHARHHPVTEHKVQPSPKELASYQGSTDPISDSLSDTLERAGEIKMQKTLVPQAMAGWGKRTSQK